MRTKMLAAAIALLFGFAACKKEDKGSAESKDPAPKTADPTKPEAPPPAKTDTPPTTTTTPPPAATTPPSDTVKLANTVPAVGAKWSEEQAQAMDLTVTAQGGKTVQLRRESVEKKQIEVLAVSAEAVTKAKITYEVTDKQQVGGKEQAMPVPHSGKTYVLDATGGKLAITADGGAAPGKEELELITKAEKRFGKADRMSVLLKDREFKKGETVDFPADQIADLMGDDEMVVEVLKLTYSANAGDHPVFDMVMKAKVTQPDSVIEMDLTGKATIDKASGEALEMTLEGPMKLTGKNTATGTMKMTGKRTLPQ
jgi:hypothetical protein